MEGFCSDDFWNSNLTWHSKKPKFTNCFANSMTLISFGAFIILAFPWTLRLIYKTPKTSIFRSKKTSWLYISKLFFNLALIASYGWKIYEEIDRNLDKSDFVTLIASPLILALAFILTIFERSKHVISSLVFSIFWLLFSIALLPTFFNSIFDGDLIVIHSCILSFSICLTLVNFFADLNGIEDEENYSPQHLSSYFAKIMFGWFEPIVWKGYKSPLTQKDLPMNPHFLNVKSNVDSFLGHWEDHKAANSVDFTNSKEKRLRLTLWKPLTKSFGGRFLFGNVIGVIHYTAVFISPMILKLLINHIDDPNEESWKGYLYAMALFVVSVFQTISFSHYVIKLNETGVSVRSSLISAICRKSLTLSNSARQNFTTGEITNLVSVDCQRIMDASGFLGVLWGAPYQVFLALLLIYNELGTSALIGSIGILVMIPINLIGGKYVEKLETRQLESKDLRIKAMNEILNGIKVLKLYAWEIPFMKRIKDIRLQEIKFLKANAWVYGVINFTFSTTPFLVTIGCFSSYVLLDPKNHILTPDKVFVCISLFNLLRIPLTLFPLTFKWTIDAMVSLKRITDFLNADELKPSRKSGSDSAIKITSGSFSWNGDALLKNMNLDIPKGSLTAIVGVVGSGKSSVIQAILGEMETLDGEILVSGSLAYVPQQAWIQNLSLRDNVLFSQDFEEDKYLTTLKVCALESDLKLLAKADLTEIGENGINLSGGQKQRISLARAVYSDKDIYLLDDPLSAVDAHVGKHIFDQVISKEKGALKYKTKVWVTNQVNYLAQADQVVFMKNGVIAEQGDFEYLMKCKGELFEFVQQSLGSLQENLDTDSSKPDKEEVEKSLNVIETDHDGKLVEDEKSLTGHVPLHVFKNFFAKMGSWFFVFFLISNALEQILHAGGILWLSDWSDTSRINQTNANDDLTFRLGVYSSISIVEALVSFSRDVTFYTRCAIAAKWIHEALLKSVMRSPMQFFDTNPLGRIINRFSADIDTMDTMIPSQITDFVWCFAEVIVTICIISYSTPLFLTSILPIGIVFWLVQRVYIVTSRQLKRLYSVSKSPLFSQFSETVSGAQIIRAFQDTDRFVQETEHKIAINNMSGYLNLISNRWLSMRVENIANVMIFLTAFFCILQRDSIKPGLAALSITYALNVIGSVVWFVRMACDLETNCVALERIFEYSKLSSEADWELSNVKDKSWPSQGRIQFEKYQTRYREGLDPVLKGIDLEIESQEKVGICGRTGAGKSSLTLALFRIIEPLEGQIFIDGVDIKSLGLHELRSKLAIIPQDPVLFTGTLRFNLDPVGDHPDEELWKALELSHLKDHVEKSLPQGLDNQVAEGGSNLSVGQRQLICLARALLKKAKILVLDEATAAVDPETDDLIQTTIRKEFKNCTVLTIAHRLNTILDSDQIVVLADGKVVEKDSPKSLLINSQSSFCAMAKDAGITLTSI